MSGSHLPKLYTVFAELYTVFYPDLESIATAAEISDFCYCQSLCKSCGVDDRILYILSMEIIIHSAIKHKGAMLVNT
jgi:hypothetical protein